MLFRSMEVMKRRESMIRALGIPDHDVEAIVQAALEEVERWTDSTSTKDVRVEPAFDGMVVEVLAGILPSR